MDASPDALADDVRARRVAIDNDLELLRVRLQKADPRRIDPRPWVRVVVPVVAGAAAIWGWRRRRRRVGTLEQLLAYTLLDLYRMEHALVGALERMQFKATNADVATAFRQHGFETEAHIERLERVFRSVGARPAPGASATVAAVVAEGDALLTRRMNRDVRDAWLIAMAQRLDHLEIAGYGTARTYAETLGLTYAGKLLQQTLEEEKAADERLTRLAERFVNPQSVGRRTT